MRKAKIGLLAALLAGLVAVMLINGVGISRYPPAGRFAAGMIRGFYPSDVRSCMGARALAAIGDRTSQWHWYHCARTLAQAQALGAFDLRYWSLLLAGALTLASAFGFALVVRFDRPPARVLRGRKLLTGAAALRAFAQTSKDESRLSGAGLEVLPGLAVSRERPPSSGEHGDALLGADGRVGAARQRRGHPRADGRAADGHVRPSHQPRARSAAAQPRVDLQPGATPGRNLGRHRQPRAAQGADVVGRRIPGCPGARARARWLCDREIHLMSFEQSFQSLGFSSREARTRGYIAYAIMMGDSILKETLREEVVTDEFVELAVQLLAPGVTTR